MMIQSQIVHFNFTQKNKHDLVAEYNKRKAYNKTYNTTTKAANKSQRATMKPLEQEKKNWL